MIVSYVVAIVEKKQIQKSKVGAAEGSCSLLMLLRLFVIRAFLVFPAGKK